MARLHNPTLSLSSPLLYIASVSFAYATATASRSTFLLASCRNLSFCFISLHVLLPHSSSTRPEARLGLCFFASCSPVLPSMMHHCASHCSTQFKLGTRSCKAKLIRTNPPDTLLPAGNIALSLTPSPCDVVDRGALAAGRSIWCHVGSTRPCRQAQAVNRHCSTSAANNPLPPRPPRETSLGPGYGLNTC